MPEFLHTESTSGNNPIDSTAVFNILGPDGQASMPSGNAVARASDTSEIQAVSLSGLLIIASGVGQWCMLSGVAV